MIVQPTRNKEESVLGGELYCSGSYLADEVFYLRLHTAMQECTRWTISITGAGSRTAHGKVQTLPGPVRVSRIGERNAQGARKIHDCRRSIAIDVSCATIRIAVAEHEECCPLRLDIGRS